MLREPTERAASLDDAGKMSCAVVDLVRDNEF